MNPPNRIDIAFSLRGQLLPVEHAKDLRDAVETALPWVKHDESVGIHRIHVAASGNGWQRPESGDESRLALSKRSRLVLRVARTDAEATLKFAGSTLLLGGHRLEVGIGKTRELEPASTLLARYVACEGNEAEAEFIARARAEFASRQLRTGALVCGLGHRIVTRHETVYTRSLMITVLPAADSVRLQCDGLGPNRRLGCGLFVAHKGVGQLEEGPQD